MPSSGSLLNAVGTGISVKVVRVLDQSSDFLTRLTEGGIEIGTMIDILSSEAEQIRVCIDSCPPVTLSNDVAGYILVEHA